ncbi:MAG: helix-turn-helix domain-containing protein [Oscillospiraceae bacterium]
MIRYDRFFALLRARGIKQTDLRDKGVHPRTFQKLLKGELIRSDTINQLCKLLE